MSAQEQGTLRPPDGDTTQLTSTANMASTLQDSNNIRSGPTIVDGTITAPPPEPRRAGYDFVGWFTEQSGGTAITFPYTINQTASFTLYARWAPKTLKASFSLEDGGTIFERSTLTGGVVEDLGRPSRSGYTFNGWFTERSGGRQITFPYTHNHTADFTLYAQWRPNQLTVTFDTRGGSTISNGSTTTDGTVADPGTPTRTGYTFTGWSVSASGGTPIRFPYEHNHTADFTLYAQWTPDPLLVTFDRQDGSVTSIRPTIAGGTIADPGAPTRTGYTFTSWSESANGGTPITFPYKHNHTEDFTLYAQWTPDPLLVTFNTQGGSAIRTRPTIAGGTIADPGTPTRTGYTFTGWSEFANGGTPISFPYKHNHTADFRLYAQWRPIRLTVTFNTQGGSAISNGSTTTDGRVADPGTPTRTGYRCTGWFTKECGGTPITFRYRHYQTADFTLYAQWTPNLLLVTFDTQRGTVISNRPTTYGGRIDDPGTPTRPGYTFTGWSVSANGGTPIKFPYKHNQITDFTLYAQWTPDPLLVTFNTQRGSAISTRPTIAGGTIADPGTPTRTGYTFTGWSVSANGGRPISFPYWHNQTTDFTLYAQWRPNQLAVTFDTQGGSTISNGSTTTDGTVADPGTPTLAGQTFSGWFTKASKGKRIQFPYTHSQTDDFTLYAQWTPQQNAVSVP